MPRALHDLRAGRRGAAVRDQARRHAPGVRSRQAAAGARARVRQAPGAARADRGPRDRGRGVLRADGSRRSRRSGSARRHCCACSISMPSRTCVSRLFTGSSRTSRSSSERWTPSMPNERLFDRIPSTRDPTRGGGRAWPPRKRRSMQRSRHSARSIRCAHRHRPSLHRARRRPVRCARVGAARRRHPGQERSELRAARASSSRRVVADGDEHRRPEVLPREARLAASASAPCAR